MGTHGAAEASRFERDGVVEQPRGQRPSRRARDGLWLVESVLHRQTNLVKSGTAGRQGVGGVHSRVRVAVNLACEENQQAKLELMLGTYSSTLIT